MATFWVPMALAVIYGLTIATVLTLLVVPVLYSLSESISESLARLVLRRKPAEAEQA